MVNPRPVGLALALVAVALGGCLNTPGDGGSRDVIVRGDGVDLDPILDAQELRPGWSLVQVDLVSESAFQIMNGEEAWGPWMVGSDLLLHGAIENGSVAIARTSLSGGANGSTLYHGVFSSSGDAIFPSADPAREVVYFSYVPPRNNPQLIRRNLAPGGNETVIGTLDNDERPGAPWAISPDGRLIATSVGTDTADGAIAHLLVFRLSGGDLGDLVYSVTNGANPRFVLDSLLVSDSLDQERGILLVDLQNKTESMLLSVSEEGRPRHPVVAGGWIWYNILASDPGNGATREEIRRLTVGGKGVERVAVSDDYRFGDFEVGAEGRTLVLQVREG